MEISLEPHLSSSDWLIEEPFYRWQRLSHYETLFTLGNGYMATRGSLEYSTHFGIPETYFAGVFDATPIHFSELVNCPSWVGLSIVADGISLDPKKGKILTYKRFLDMKKGILFHLLIWKDTQGRITKYEGARLVHLSRKHLGLIWGTLTPVNYSGSVTLRADLNGNVFNTGPAPQIKLKHCSVKHQQSLQSGGIYLEASTRASRIDIGEAAATLVHAPCKRDVEYDRDRVSENVTFRAVRGKPISFEKYVTFYTSRDVRGVKTACQRALSEALATGASSLVREHLSSWEEKWRIADIRIEGDLQAQRLLRFNIFHLIQLASRDDDVSIGAKGLHGEGYRGHVFWDTEIYMLPFYIYTNPEAARCLLTYRYHRLEAARENAKLDGFKGGKFPWESADTGKDVTPIFGADLISGHGVAERCETEMQDHVVADVAYGVNHYWKATGDKKFYRDFGAEIILETARFWASRVEFDRRKGKYVIKHTMGPDELHSDVENSIYTNYLAGWNLQTAVKASKFLKSKYPTHWRKLKKSLHLSEREILDWLRIAQNTYIARPRKDGLYEQFDGYFKLQDIELRKRKDRRPIVPRKYWHRFGETQLIKQADIVLLQYLLSEKFAEKSKKANFSYYEPRTTHMSSLSPSIYSIIASEVGQWKRAYEYFLLSAGMDLSRTAYSSDGIHAACLGGTWQAAVNGFGGLRIVNDQLSFCPQLPPKWKSLRFKLKWRGEILRIRVTPRKFYANLESAKKGKLLKVSVMGKPCSIGPSGIQVPLKV